MIRFVKIDRAVLGVCNGNHAAAYTLTVIEISTRYGGWSKGLEALSETCMISRRSLCSYLTFFKSKKLVETDENGIFRITERVQKLHTTECKNCTERVQKLHASSAKIALNTIITNNNKYPLSDDGAFGEAEQFGIVLENFVKHYEAVTNSPYIPNFASNQNSCRELASQFLQLAKVMVFRETNEDRDPTPDEFTAVVQQWLSKGYEAADRWQRDRWSIELISKQFSIITKKINENEL